MFLRDAIFRNTIFEPWWFMLIRRIFALFFVGLVVTYGIFQLEYLTTFISTPNIIIIEPKYNMSHINFPGFIICPGSVSPNFVNDTVEKQSDPQFSVTCGRSSAIGPETLSDNTNVTDPECSKDFSIENGCLKFRSKDIVDNQNSNYGSNGEGDLMDPKVSQGFNRTFMFFNIVPNENDQQLFYTIYFDEYQHYDDKTYNIENDNENIEYNMFPIEMGQRTILEYSITIHRVYSTPLMGQLNTRPDNSSIEIKADTKTIQKKQVDSNRQPATQFVLMPKMPHYTREEIEKYEYHPISAISNLGGFYGAIVAFYMTCFGMPKIEPWGVFQKTIFRCWPCRRSFKRHLAEKYISGGGIPLGEDIDDRPEGASLEDRLQILEYLLKDYYLDSYYLEKLRMTKLYYEDQEKRYKQLESLFEMKNRSVEISLIPSPTFPPAFPSPTFPSATYPSGYSNYEEEVGVGTSSASASSSSPSVCVRINF